MNKPLSEWLNSFWDNGKKPDKVLPGQIWTLFRPENKEDEDIELGTIVIVTSSDQETVKVVVASDERDYVRGIDIELTTDHHPYPESLFVMPDTESQIMTSSFERASYLGNLNVEGIEAFLNGRQQYQKILNAQMRLSYFESLGEISDEQIKKAHQDGLLKLLPLKVIPQAFHDFKSSLMKNVMPQQISDQSSQMKGKHGAGIEFQQYQDILSELTLFLVENKSNSQVIQKIKPLLRKICLYVFSISHNPVDFASISRILGELTNKLESDLGILDLQYFFNGLSGEPSSEMSLTEVPLSGLLELSTLDQGLTKAKS